MPQNELYRAIPEPIIQPYQGWKSRREDPRAKAKAGRALSLAGRRGLSRRRTRYWLNQFEKWARRGGGWTCEIGPPVRHLIVQNF